VTTQAAVLDLITGLARERQMATLFITDDLGLATEYCDRIIVMHAGHAVESAPTKALFARPRHPCTARLISSTPDDTSPIDSLAPVPGSGEIRASVVGNRRSTGDATQAALGYWYPLSRRTALYGSVGSISNDGSAAFSLWPARQDPGAPAQAGGLDVRGMQVGMRHTF